MGDIHEERQVLVYIKTVPLVCDDVEKKSFFFRATKKKRSVRKLWTEEGWLYNVRLGGFTSDKRFNESLVLLRYCDIVISHKIIEHHYRRVFMLPFLVFPVVYGVRKIEIYRKRDNGRIYASKKRKKRKPEEGNAYNGDVAFF